MTDDRVVEMCDSDNCDDDATCVVAVDRDDDGRKRVVLCDECFDSVALDLSYAAARLGYRCTMRPVIGVDDD